MLEALQRVQNHGSVLAPERIVPLSGRRSVAHTAGAYGLVQEDSEFIEFSPQHEFAMLLDHVRKQVQDSR